MRNLEQRLERLERKLGAHEPEVMMIRLATFGDEESLMAGWKDNLGFDCARLPDESDEDLAKRAVAEAKARAIPSASGSTLLVSYALIPGSASSLGASHSNDGLAILKRRSPVPP